MEMENAFLELAIAFLDFWVLIVQEQPALCCAVGMGSTPKDVVSVTVAGKGQSVTCPTHSASTRHVGAVGFV